MAAKVITAALPRVFFLLALVAAAAADGRSREVSTAPRLSLGELRPVTPRLLAGPTLLQELVVSRDFLAWLWLPAQS
ncbi:hypothetical protein E2C01_086076 [Portunus trituberculatus]|uniref:Uncharacterized protein n=1 Tax=Portunus trituberculatus TaxID=210409 RepID=A0A5B7J9A8_PORTR|nr:hypothetical protein [Portunus trituberculatus]